MTACEYRVLEYARTELQPAGNSFLVVFRIPEWQKAIRGCVLDQWQMRAEVEDPFDLAYINDLLHDLGLLNFREAQAGEAFFEVIRAMASGPIRTALAGSLEPIPESLMSVLLSEIPIQTCSVESFNTIILILERLGPPCPVDDGGSRA